MGELHLVVHPLVVELSAVRISQRVVERQTPRDLQPHIAVLNLRFTLISRLGVLIRAVFVLLNRRDRLIRLGRLLS